MRSYAAELFRLQEYYPHVPLSALAEEMAVSLQAASRMVRRLQKAGLVAHIPYQGLRLTPEGESQALPAIRRHRLTEVFLVQVMGFGWDEVHDLTDHLEPGINGILEGRIDEILDHPTRCPHGEPIPDLDGRLPRLDDAPLTTVEPGVTARVSRIRTHDMAQLRYVGELGLKPGKRFHLLSQAPFDGPLRIDLGSEELVLGFNLASTIWVEIEE
jgi:DtxR family Mn-dependent transcriptional regulator